MKKRVVAVIVAAFTLMFVWSPAANASVATGYYATQVSGWSYTVFEINPPTTAGERITWAIDTPYNNASVPFRSSLYCKNSSSGVLTWRGSASGNLFTGASGTMSSPATLTSFCQSGEVIVGASVTYDVTPSQLVLDYRIGVAAQSPAPVVDAGNCSLSDTQLVMLARSAGFDNTNIQTAVAIAIAESSGKVNALHFNGPNPGSWDIGLWQVNDVAHPSYDRNRLGTDPLYNAVAAHDIWATGSTYQPWVTYNSGAYIKYMTRANTAMQDAGTGTLPLINCSGALGNPSDPDYNGDPTDQSDGSCTGWNPLTYVKCALIWAFKPGSDTFNSWTSFQQTASACAPVAFINAAFEFTTGIVDVVTSQFDFNDNGPNFAQGLPGAPGQYFSPIKGARDAIDAVGGVHDEQDPTQSYKWSIVFKLMQVSIWGGVVYTAWSRIGKSFGSKG